MNIHTYYDKITSFGQKSKRFPQLIVLLLVLLIIWLVADTVQLVLQPLEILPQLKLQQTIQVKAPTNIASDHLFGVYSASLAGLPETRLQITLQGTEVSLLSDHDSHAIITAAGKPAKAYGVGSQVPGGATITKIEWNRVILNHGGRLEQLKMPVPKLKYSSPPGLSLKAYN